MYYIAQNRTLIFNIYEIEMKGISKDEVYSNTNYWGWYKWLNLCG